MANVIPCTGCALPLERVTREQWQAKPTDYRDVSIRGCHQTMLDMDRETGATILRHVFVAWIA